MTPRAQIVSAVPLGPDQLSRLAEWDVTVVDFTKTSRDDLRAALAGAEGLLVNSHSPVDQEMIDHSTRLRVISTISVGYDHIAVATTTSRGICVTNAPVLSDAVADLTLGLMVMVARRLDEATADMARGTWSDGRLGTDLRGKTLLLVGFGRIAREVASRALACKLDVTYFDVRADVPAMPGVERVATLAEGLARADIVSLHVDLNPSTFHLLDAATIGLMKPTAIVLNTSRGGVIDQGALTLALAEGRLGGAGLDVLETEPPAADDPLLSMPNVVVLPHIGSATIETRDAMRDCAINNLIACMRGDDCAHVLTF